MSPDAREQQQRQILADAYRAADLTLEELWMRYIGLGGDADLVEVEAYLHDIVALPALQRDLLAQAVNERLDELAPSRRVPYSRPLPELRPDRGPLAALVKVLDGAHLAPPERLPAVTAAAGRALGVQVGIYLVDDDQRRLVPLPGPPRGMSPARALDVEATPAGRAFRLVRTVPAQEAGRPRLWVPLLDGVERLGVLDVLLSDAADLHDRQLREHCGWLSALLGHLLTSVGEYGDTLAVARRARPRTPAAELIRALLPPLTAATDEITLAGRVAAGDLVGGDAFDYALSEATVNLAIFTTKGRALGGSLITAATMAAYHSARRDGHDLAAQAQAIDETLAAQFGGRASATGILAELDLPTGQLRYLVAGHPPPLVLRAGRATRTLTGGRRPPLGLAPADVPVGVEPLQPGDRIVLHTDGVTQAYDRGGRAFGRPRLVDFLERDTTSAALPAETVRRLIQAVRHHQSGVQHDDATVLLAHWNPRNAPPPAR